MIFLLAILAGILSPPATAERVAVTITLFISLTVMIGSAVYTVLWHKRERRLLKEREDAVRAQRASGMTIGDWLDRQNEAADKAK